MEKITVEETGKVKVRPVAIDPDNDRIKFTATSPLGRDLRWKTDYDDAGEYDVIVTVTDGKRTDEKTVNIIVENKNRAPKFKSLKTKRVKEGQEITISLSVSDADKDRIELSLEDAPEGAFLIDNFIKYTPTFETSIKGEKKIMFNVIATDGQDTIKQTIIIKVKNVNRLPIVTTASPGRISNAYVGEPVLFTVEAEDPDNDTLSYKWKFDTFNSYKGTNALRRTFVTPGKKTIKLLISDGKRSITKEWFVNVIERQVKTTTKVTTKVITKQVTTTKKPAGSITYVIDNADIPPPNNVNVLVFD